FPITGSLSIMSVPADVAYPSAGTALGRDRGPVRPHRRGIPFRPAAIANTGWRPAVARAYAAAPSAARAWPGLDPVETTRLFGRLDDGRAVHAHRLQGD